MRFYTNVGIHRGQITHVGYSNGKKFIQSKEFCPSLAIPAGPGKNTHLKNLYGKPLEEIGFGSIREYRDYVRNYADAINFHGEISPAYQFINFEYGKMDYDPSQVRVLMYDIEVISDGKFPKPEDAAYPVTSISVRDSKTSHMFVFGIGKYDSSKSITDIPSDKILYYQCKDEVNLLSRFIDFFRVSQPDILIGWNNKGFDDPYICKRIHDVLGQQALNLLSPFDKVNYNSSIGRDGRIRYNVDIHGITILDYMELYKKYMPGDRESFSLDAIATYELGDTKIDYEEYDDLFELYEKNYQKFIDYNIYDTELLKKLDDKLGLINLVITVAYMARCNYSDVMSPVKTWDVTIYNILKDKNIVIPPQNKNHNRGSYPGAYVHDPKPGIYDWMVSADLDSLYPHLIMQWNISPETIVEGAMYPVNGEEIDDKFFSDISDKHPDFILAGNGNYFRKDKKGFTAEIMEDFYAKRKAIKKDMLKLKQEYENSKDETLVPQITKLDNEQLARKILLNSFYGALANEYFRYFDVRLASAITLSGQLAIKWIMKSLNKKLKDGFSINNAVCYCDTDSVVGDSIIYVNRNPIKIEDYFNQVNGKYLKKDIFNEDYIKEVIGDTSLSVSPDKSIQEKPIKYIMKHKVKKEMFKITAQNREVIVTEDHSIMVLRNKSIISVKPKEILETDEIIYIE